MPEPPFHDIAAEEEIPAGVIRSFSIEGRRIAVVHASKGLFAIDDACPHRGGPLSEGDVQGCEIICPWHFWAFDLETGRHSGGSRFAVCTHEVRLAGGRVLVRLAPPDDPPWMAR